MNNTRQTFNLARNIVARHFSKTAAKNAEIINPKTQQLKAKQLKFGLDDGTPVYLKGGVGDKILFQATSLLTLVGLGMCLETYYTLAIK